MIKPKWGYGYKQAQDKLEWPPGWESEEQKKILRKRRLFYEIKLHDWIVKHDLDGDRNIIKTILDRGVGYDRPFDLCEIIIDLKIYTKEENEEIVYKEFKDLDTVMKD